MMSRFPKVTETFVLREMNEMERQGLAIEVYPLQREKSAVIQPDAQSYVERAHYVSLTSWSVWRDNVATFLRRPGDYLRIVMTLVRANMGSPRFLLGALVFFPKAVRFAKLMQQQRIEHVHAHFASHPAAMAFVIHRLTGIPYSFSAHGSDLHRDQHMLLEKTREADFVVAISDYNRNMILDVCGPEYADKVHVVHCGIDPKHFPARSEPTDYDAGHGPFRIVCVGTLHEVKGQRFLIQACHLLKTEGLDVACHLLGGGPDERALREEARRLGVDGNIRFHGVCTSQEVRAQLQQADVLAAPSVPSRDGRREGIPVVLMEAMSTGVPCVSSRLSGIPELVEHEQTGLLTSPGDAADIASALKRLANDASLRRRFAQSGLEKVQREFHLAANARTLARHFPVTVPAGKGPTKS